MKFDDATYKVTNPGRFGAVALTVGGLGLALSLVAVFVDSPRFYFGWLTAFYFWTTLALGGLFFTMLHHLTGARWSVVLRRISETMMMQLPWTTAAFIPVFFGIHDLYHWSHAEAVAHDAILQSKAGYLNTGFFTIRAVAYFAVWSLIAVALYRVSRRQDEGNTVEGTAKMRKSSAIGMMLFAVTTTFAAWDWLMSLEPHWFSTIFGVYSFGGAFFGSLGFMTAVCLLLRHNGALHNVITLDHYHDLGKLMFGFTVFWSYIAFSQYFLIWYANIPEETFWYLNRWQGGWKTVSLVLMFGHFVLPFVVMIFRNVKRSPVIMAIMALWFMIIHWVDIYWLAFPTLLPEGATLSWIEVVAAVGLGGIFLGLFWWRLTGAPLVPVGDPNLQRSITFTNH